MTLSPVTDHPGHGAATDPPGVRASVPWWTVLPLAVVLSFADGFWITSMRGAVGPAGRGQAPFATWWHESSVLVPAYVCAVLCALMLARWWAGRGSARRGTLVVATLLVGLAGTVVGVTHMAAASTADYLSQWHMLQTMTMMRADCPSDCLERLRQDTLGLQVHAVAAGALLLLVTNLGAVVWVTMCRGGRLEVARLRPAPRDSGSARDLGRQLRQLLAAALVGAALIHLAVVPEHLEEWPAAGTFFVLLSLAELATAAAVLQRPGRASLLLAAATSLGPLVVWAWSRAWGLPFGPDPFVPEPVGLPDVAAVVLEVAALALAVLLLGRAPVLAGRARSSEHLGHLASIAVVAVTVIALAATQPGWFDVLPLAGHPHG